MGLIRTNPWSNMSGHRVLLPTPVVAGCGPTVGAAPADAGDPMAGPQGGGKQRRHRHTAEEWEDVKASFKELYSQPGLNFPKPNASTMILPVTYSISRHN